MIITGEQRRAATVGANKGSSLPKPKDAKPVAKDPIKASNADLPSDATGKLAGQMKIIGLSGLKKQLGKHWDARLSTIRSAIENITSKYLTANDVVLPVGEDHYVIIFGSDDPAEADRVSGQIAAALSRVLVGDDATKLIKVRADVGKIEPAKNGKPKFKSTKKLTPVCDGDIDFMEESSPSQTSGEDATPCALAEPAPQPRKARKPVYEIGHFPIWNMQQEALVGYALLPIIEKETGDALTEHDVLPADSSDAEVARLDTHLLQAQIKTAADHYRKSTRSLLLSQLHYRTLSLTPVFERIMKIVSEVPDVIKKTLMLEIIGLTDSSTPALIAQRACMLGNAVGALTIRVPSLHFSIADCVAMKATAVAYQMPPDVNLVNFLPQAKTFIGHAKDARLITSFEYVPSVQVASNLKAAGAIISTGMILGGPYDTPGKMKPMTLEQIRDGDISPY